MERTLETWRNSGRGLVIIVKLDSRGNPTHEAIPAGKSATLTYEERLMNQERAANEDLDVFQNGLLTPVRIFDGTEDAKEIASNPNLLTDESIEAMFKEHFKTFEKNVKGISNPITVARILEVAERIDATNNQVKVIRTRLRDLDPTFITSGDDGEITHLGHIHGEPDEKRFGPDGEYEPNPVSTR